MLCTNVFQEGNCGFLIQNGYMICYIEYTKIKYHEKKYVMHELEVVSIVHALKMWRHYLMVKTFEL